MAACYYITTGITTQDESCDSDFGGIVKLYLANKRYLTSVRKNSESVITGLTLSNSAKFFEYTFDDVTGSMFNEDVAEDNSSGFVTQSINFTLRQYNQEKKNILDKMRRGRFAAIIQRPDNTYWLVGETGFGLKATINSTTGQVQTDQPGVTVNLTSTVIKFADEVSSSALTALLA